MQVSARVRDVVGGGDDGWSLYYRARAMAAAGTPVVMLTIGDHDIKTDPSILSAMAASMSSGNLGYSPVNGAANLRAVIAERMTARVGQAVDPGQIVVTPGGQAGLFAAMMAALDPGQSCIVFDPFYATYQQTVRAASGRPILVATRPEDGFQPDIEAVRAALAPDTRAILLNSPNNPTGAVYDRQRLEALAALCAERDIWLISDEVYASQVWDGAHLSPAALPGMADRTLIVDSLSKSHAMTGSRLGWVCAPEAAAVRLADLANTTNYGVPSFIQDAAVYALSVGGDIEAAIAARYRARRDGVLRALGNGAAVGIVPPQSGMYIMLDIRKTGLSGDAFAEKLLEAEKIAVMPGESFGDAAAGHLRIALTQPEAVLVDAIRRTAAFAEGLG